MADTKERRTQNPERFKVRGDKVYPDGSTTAVDVVTPGFGQTETFDPDSSEAQERSGGTLDLNKPLGDMTHAELDAYAAQEGVDLAGATTKQDKVDLINGSASPT